MKEYLPPYEINQTLPFAGYPKQIAKTIDWLRWNGRSIFRVQFTMGFDKLSQGQILFVYDFAKGELISIEKFHGKCKELKATRPLSIYVDALNEDIETYYKTMGDYYSSEAKLKKAVEDYNSGGKTEELKQSYFIIKKERDDYLFKSIPALFTQAIQWGPGFSSEKVEFRKFKDSYLKSYLEWQEAGSHPEQKPTFSTWLDVFKEEEVIGIGLEVAKIVTAKGGPWGGEGASASDTSSLTKKQGSEKKPKKAKSIPYTAHCRFPIYIKATTKEEAEDIFRASKISVIGKYNMSASNWRGVYHLPASPSEYEGKWSIPCYIKVFFDAVDVNGARKKLDELYVDVKTCWDNGIEKDEGSQMCSTCAWSFNILPSINSELGYTARNTPSWPWNKVWQRQLEVEDDHILSPADSVEIGTNKILSQYNQPLLPWEVSYILQIYGINPAGKTSNDITLEEFGQMPGIEAVKLQGEASTHLQLKK
jgi:hypothetical protein